MDILTKDGIKRILTPKEIKKIRKYNLMPQVEKAVIDVWSSEPEEKKVSTSKTMKSVIMSCFVVFTLFLFPVLLWVKFLTPQNNSYLINLIGENYTRYLDGVLHIYIFLIWILQIMAILIGIGKIIWISMEEKKIQDKIFSKSFLNTWKGPNILRKTYNNLFFLAVIVGLVINGYFFLPLVWIISKIIWTIYNQIVKTKVQKKMDTLL